MLNGYIFIILKIYYTSFFIANVYYKLFEKLIKSFFFIKVIKISFLLLVIVNFLFFFVCI